MVLEFWHSINLQISPPCSACSGKARSSSKDTLPMIWSLCLWSKSSGWCSSVLDFSRQWVLQDIWCPSWVYLSSTISWLSNFRNGCFRRRSVHINFWGHSRSSWSFRRESRWTGSKFPCRTPWDAFPAPRRCCVQAVPISWAGTCRSFRSTACPHSFASLRNSWWSSRGCWWPASNWCWYHRSLPSPHSAANWYPGYAEAWVFLSGYGDFGGCRGEDWGRSGTGWASFWAFLGDWSVMISSL